MDFQIQLTDGNSDLYGIGNNIFIERDKSTGLWRALSLRGGWIQAISCVCFGKTAENISRYLHKGSKVGIDGRIQTGSYINRQGTKVYTTDVIADHIDFLDSRSEDTIQRYDQGTAYSGTYGWGGSR